MSRPSASWIAFIAVMVLAACILFPNLDAAQWRTWDEGLYGRLARNALEHGRYLHAVDESGALYARFSKPPMTIWLSAASLSLFGMSVEALRLPFALGMLSLIGIAFGWGRRIGGLPMAVAWSLGLTVCAATTRWGRHACIEPMFVAGLLGGLWGYHAAVNAPTMRKMLGPATAAGFAFAFAVLTKQLAVGMAIAAVAGVEVWRRDPRMLLRLGLVLGIPTLVGVLWFVWAGAATDGAIFDVLVDRGVRRRMEGFGAGQNARTLNELGNVVEDAGFPIPWPLGAAGLALLFATRLRISKRSPDPSVVLPVWFVLNVLVFDNLSASMLPWYALHIIVPTIGGAAWMVAGAFSSTGQRQVAALGWISLGVVAVIAAEPIASQLDIALVAGALLLLSGLGHVRIARTVAVVGVVLLGVAAKLRDPELHAPAQPFSPLMSALSNAPRVAVDHGTGLPELGVRGLYGPHAHKVRRPPWPTQDDDAYVVAWTLPVEYSPPPGVELIRSAGVSAFVGDLSQRAWTRSSLTDLLDAGPVTFEAEHLGADRWQTTAHEAGASGGALRRYSLFRTEKPPKIPLSIGPGLWLPRGQYTLEVWMRWSCPDRAAERTAAVVTASANARELSRQTLSCADGPDELTPIPLAVTLKEPGLLTVRVGYRYGVVEHDKTVMTRRD